MGYEVSTDSPYGERLDTIGEQMSMAKLPGIGSRLAAARAKKQASQVKAAAMVEISDKTYKNYEADKREIPLSTAVAFCEAFEVELDWLVFGDQENAHEKTAALVSEIIEALNAAAQDRNLALSPIRAGKLGGLIFRNCADKGTSPKVEAGLILDAFDSE